MRLRGIALGLIALALAGCTAAPETEAAPAPSPTSTAAAFRWPRVEGRIVQDVVTEHEHLMRIAVDDPDRGYAQARELLVKAGFQLTKDRPATGGGSGQACTTALCVSFGADTLADEGPGVTYEAFHSTGVVPLP